PSLASSTVLYILPPLPSSSLVPYTTLFRSVLKAPNDHDSDRHISKALEMTTIGSATTTDRTPIAVFVRAEYSRNVRSSNGEVETWHPHAGPWSVPESSARPWRARSSCVMTAPTSRSSTRKTTLPPIRPATPPVSSTPVSTTSPAASRPDSAVAASRCCSTSPM